MVNTRRLLQLVTVLNVLSGIVHIVAPDRLTRIIRRLYDLVLAVDFQPREETRLRVQLVGVASLLLAALSYRLSTADST